MKLKSILSSKPFQLIVSVSGIYFSYIITGVIQERLFLNDYSGLNRPAGTFPRFNFAFATSLFQNILSYMLAKLVIYFSSTQKGNKMDRKFEISMGALSFATVFLTSQSLVYVSFLVQTIMKSSKILSIILTSIVFGFKGHHTARQYLCGLLITVGVIIFTLTQQKGHESTSSLLGIAALLLSLFCDGLLGTLQEDVRRKCSPDKWEQMRALNKWGALFCFGVAIVTRQLDGFIVYVIDQPLVIQDLAWMTFLTTLGQIFIFYTLEHFSSYALSIISTTRRFFTVLFSIVIYGHYIESLQWVAIVLVFTGVFLEISASQSVKKFEELKSTPMEEEKMMINHEKE